MDMAVIGAGNTGQIMAFDLAQKGAQVRLYDRDREKVGYLARHGLEAEGRLRGKVSPFLATADMREAVRGAQAICVTTTAAGHRPVAEAMRPYLEEGQIVIIFNANWGALEFHQVFGASGGMRRVLVGETGSQLNIGSASGQGKIFAKQIKENVSLAMIEKGWTDAVIAVLRPFFPQFTKAANVLETSLSSANAMVHTPICLFNLSRIDLGQDFLFYRDGASRSTVAYIEHIDRKRMAIMAALGLEARTMLEVINSFWPDKKDSLLRRDPGQSVVPDGQGAAIPGPPFPDRGFAVRHHAARPPRAGAWSAHAVHGRDARNLRPFPGARSVGNGFRPDVVELAAIRN